ncbi:MAG: DUF1778 domain-containing protein [Ilumatobacteraceae bacterium]|jgi:predicted transcriptional regulator|nr:DUF1778 domain-containing protein [Ilumatobacteraceae bacterium]
MNTTTIRIEDTLKARLAAAAGQVGKTAHGFILEAIRESVEQAELDHEFHALADQRWQALQTTGETVSWEQARAYLVGRSRGENPSKPAARSSNA